MATDVEIHRLQKKYSAQWGALSRLVWPEDSKETGHNALPEAKHAAGRLADALIRRGRLKRDRVLVEAGARLCTRLLQENYLALAEALYILACGRWPLLSNDEWDALCKLAAPTRLGGLIDTKADKHDVMSELLLLIVVDVMSKGRPVHVDISEGDTDFDELVLGTQVDFVQDPWRPKVSGSVLNPGQVPTKVYLATNLAAFVYEVELEDRVLRYALPFGEVVNPTPQAPTQEGGETTK